MIIDRPTIEALALNPDQCIDWVRQDFLFKSQAQLPAKMSVHPHGDDFITTMPCLLPEQMQRFGVKVVSRIAGNNPALKSDILLYNSRSGDLLAILDGNLITTLRTAAVAQLAIETLQNSHSSVYALMGLGNTGSATLRFLLHRFRNRSGITIRLLNYKQHAVDTVERLSSLYPGVKFEIADTVNSLVEGADVIVSCITSADALLVDNTDRFKPGALLVPVHTRGFQNCDATFDRIVGDDYDHIKGFKYFASFRQFVELGDVLAGKTAGRISDSERIIAYNIGLGLHDIYFASQIYDMVNS